MLYCSLSCSAKARAEKNRKPHFCRSCATVIPKTRKVCDACKYYSSDASLLVQELKVKYGPSKFHSVIRAHARAQYKNSGKPFACLWCGYSRHVDIAHIVSVKYGREHNFTMDLINNHHNLIALCKNHHWEFDNGYLEIRDGKDMFEVEPDN